MATAIVTSFDQQCDSAGDPLSGALVYVYDVGTTTLRSIFTDDGLSVAAANPIVCDSAGRHDMRYTATGSYKIVVKTSADVTVYTRDNIDGSIPIGASGILAIANGGTAADNASTALANLGGVTAAEFSSLSAEVAALTGASASTEKTHIATGTTAERPVPAAEGDIRRNTTLSTYEGYDGAAWVNFVVQPTSITDPSATDTQEGLIELAVQSEMETGTDVVRAVTPGRVQYHPGVAKAWAKFAGASGTIAVSHNITSVVRDSAGDYTVTIATDFSSADYAILLTAFHTSAVPTVYVLTQAAGSFTIKAVNASSTDTDPDAIFFCCFGDQA
jgi:hypothetical protein